MALTVLRTDYMDDALKTLIQGTLTGPFIIPTNEAVTWLTAKTFKKMGVKTPGMRNYGRNAEGIGGNLVKSADNFEQTFTIGHERAVNIYLDKLDQVQTNGTINPSLLLDDFMAQQYNPEVDAYFFSKVATTAIAENLYTATAITAYTKDNVYEKLQAGLLNGRLRAYAASGALICFVNSTIMSLLEQASNFDRRISVENRAIVPSEGADLVTRIARINSVNYIEVIDDERFYTAFDFIPTDDFLSFEPGTGAYKINYLYATVGAVQTVPYFNDIYIYQPGEVQGVNGTVVDVYPVWDTFIYKNNKGGGQIDSIFVDRDTTAV